MLKKTLIGSMIICSSLFAYSFGQLTNNITNIITDKIVNKSINTADEFIDPKEEKKQVKQKPLAKGRASTKKVRSIIPSSNKQVVYAQTPTIKKGDTKIEWNR